MDARTTTFAGTCGIHMDTHVAGPRSRSTRCRQVVNEKRPTRFADEIAESNVLGCAAVAAVTAASPDSAVDEYVG
jgi:hypothetical protein